jgi:hypothetical protein
MLSSADVAVVVFVAYYFTGMTMVAFHSKVSPLHRPGYVRLGQVRRVLAGTMWPVVARANRELGWFVVTFVSALIVVAIEYWIFGKFVDSTFWRVAIVWLACLVPVVNAPLALVGVVLWLIVAKPLGLRVPSGMDSLTKD